MKKGETQSGCKLAFDASQGLNKGERHGVVANLHFMKQKARKKGVGWSVIELERSERRCKQGVGKGESHGVGASWRLRQKSKGRVWGLTVT